MRPKYILQATVAVSMLALASCKKSFLDKKPYTGISLDGSVKNDADMNVAINGVYSNMRTTSLYGRTLPIRGELMSDNTFLTTANSGRYTSFNQYTIISTDGDVNSVWLQAYSVIKNANNIINSGLDPASGDNISQFLAEAYAARALMHFELVRNFAAPYTVDPSKPGIPIVLKYDATALPGRNTIKEVYTQIIADLTKAASLSKFAIGGNMTINATGVTRTVNTSFISKYAISALLARVYQFMGDWANAKAAALDVVTNGGFTLASSTALSSYWATLNPRTDKLETIFEITSDANNNNGSDYLGGFYVPSNLGGGYGDVLCTPELYNSYAATDVRKNLITVGTRSGQVGTAYIVRKYTGNTTDYDDTKILRYADVLLILAEAYYNTNDPANANLYLNKIAQQRDPAFAGYSHTGTQILDDIISERRKELAFEGNRFYDLYRLQKSFTKIVDQDAPQRNVSVTPTTTNVLFPIPNTETSVNAKLKAQQNPGYN